MTVKHQIRCAESDIFVLEKQNGFHLTIGARVNPLSYGNKLAEFGSLGSAIDAAERFCRLYALSKEYGYHLDDTKFRKEGKLSIPVSDLLDLGLSADQMKSLLEREAVLYENGREA